MEITNNRAPVVSACSKDLYARVVQRRVFTKWINVHLQEAGIQIEDIGALKRSKITGKLLEILTDREVPVSHREHKTRKQERREWERILSFLETENPHFDHFGKCDLPL